MFRIRILCTAVTVLSACGPATTTAVFPSFRHPLLHHHSEPASSQSTVTRRQTSSRPEKLSAPKSFSHPLLNRPAVFHDRRWFSGDRIENRLAIARQARNMLTNGPARFKVGARTYRQDCSGFVMAVLAARGLDIDQLLDPKSQGGVAALYRWADDHGSIHYRKVPAIGDLVFFDNTYDRNRDGRLNDPLTHIGIVERVDPDGTVSVIHHVRRGILRYKLNRFKPALRRDPASRKVLNHYLRIVPPSSKRRGRRLTGELFHAFATIVR